MYIISVYIYVCVYIHIYISYIKDDRNHLWRLVEALHLVHGRLQVLLDAARSRGVPALLLLRGLEDLLHVVDVDHRGRHVLYALTKGL